MSIRRLRVLLDHLPPESHTRTAMRRQATPEQLEAAQEGARPDLAPWSSVEMLLASLLDATRAQTSVLVASNGGSPMDLTPTPRPGIPPQTTSPKRLTDEQRRALDPRLRNEPREA
jgi:hypothetical protein